MQDFKKNDIHIKSTIEQGLNKVLLIVKSTVSAFSRETDRQRERFLIKNWLISHMTVGSGKSKTCRAG